MRKKPIFGCEKNPRHTKAQKQKVIVRLCRVAFCTFQHLVFVLCRLCLARRARHYVTRITCIEALHYSVGPECAQYNRQDDTHAIGSASRQHFFFIYVHHTKCETRRSFKGVGVSCVLHAWERRVCMYLQKCACVWYTVG